MTELKSNCLDESQEGEMIWHIIIIIIIIIMIIIIIIIIIMSVFYSANFNSDKSPCSKALLISDRKHTI